jgi:FkbM family methyltransferase
MNKIKKILIASKAIYNSRKIIKNIYSSLYQYLILRKQNIELKLRSEKIIVIPRLLYPEIIYYYYMGYIKNITEDRIYLEIDNKTFRLPLKEIELLGFQDIIKLLKSGWLYYENYWEKNNIRFKHLYGVIYEVFEKEDYKFLNVKDKNVLDIGAFVGDSAIYFILKGAKKVYAIEPHPDAYKEMLENIKLNNMEDKIIPINIGINYEKDYIFINTKNFAQIAGSFFNSNNKGIKIPAGKLSDIIDKYNIDAQILKMDCEGCEYDIILKDYDTIKEFEEIGFEYHINQIKTPINKLLDKLNNDFECKIIEEKSKDIGLIHCINKK